MYSHICISVNNYEYIVLYSWMLLPRLCVSDKHIYVYTYIYTYIYEYIYICIYICTYTFIYMYIYTCIHKNVWVHICTSMHIYIHIYLCIYRYVYIYWLWHHTIMQQWICVYLSQYCFQLKLVAHFFWILPKFDPPFDFNLTKTPLEHSPEL